MELTHSTHSGHSTHTTHSLTPLTHSLTDLPDLLAKNLQKTSVLITDARFLKIPHSLTHSLTFLTFLGNVAFALRMCSMYLPVLFCCFCDFGAADTGPRRRTRKNSKKNMGCYSKSALSSNAMYFHPVFWLLAMSFARFFYFESSIRARTKSKVASSERTRKSGDQRK